MVFRCTVRGEKVVMLGGGMILVLSLRVLRIGGGPGLMVDTQFSRSLPHSFGITASSQGIRYCCTCSGLSLNTSLSSITAIHQWLFSRRPLFTTIFL